MARDKTALINIYLSMTYQFVISGNTSAVPRDRPCRNLLRWLRFACRVFLLLVLASDRPIVGAGLFALQDSQVSIDLFDLNTASCRFCSCLRRTCWIYHNIVWICYHCSRLWSCGREKIRKRTSMSLPRPLRLCRSSLTICRTPCTKSPLIQN